MVGGMGWLKQGSQEKLKPSVPHSCYAFMGSTGAKKPVLSQQESWLFISHVPGTVRLLILQEQHDHLG
mgnify:CR=1 FL=1